ncbi:hypothetical protein WOSG25_180420 [Weissella oryzae SG25]|uniref:DUF3850 domain-containing protein n=1 Tax=Weissella oryzae (strain DSM 25784 / JCM 18191 / LMG 30913 / SG25) TaxID=1329250 RepID=A0A069D3C8_WEIOS|nr:DUF3850 domain-containing protein [Weissella oryzae]GAK31891.1 hypothetical protein WOSG25_180420 [Weissella oryzae SG25]
MKAHNLKLDNEYFDDVANSLKKFEIRKNDRDYQVGDLLFLQRYSNGQYLKRTGWGGSSVVGATKENADTLLAQVVYMTEYAQRDGYVVLGIKLVDIVDKAEN